MSASRLASIFRSRWLSLVWITIRCCVIAPRCRSQSVRHDLEGMAYEAAALLDRLMDGKAPPATPRRIVPKGVVIRI